MSAIRSKSHFRVGKVKAYQRGKVWYLCYFENGQRRRPRVGPNREAAKQLAAQTHAQLEIGAPALLSFDNISIPDLRERWLQHHEQILRSSVQTVRRYRAATDHLLCFIRAVCPLKFAAQFRVNHAEEFTAYLRTLEVSPNGHKHSEKRRLFDKGIKFILETCRALFSYASKRRHLSPYAANPFSEMGVDKIPVEVERPKLLLTAGQERLFLEACDEWQRPLFLTLMLTGMRPGELTHLLLPDDINFTTRTIYIRNRAKLGWQVKTRNEREIPLGPELGALLQQMTGVRAHGTLFWRRRFHKGDEPALHTLSESALMVELGTRIRKGEAEKTQSLTRSEHLGICRRVWRDCGAVKPESIRREFMQITKKISIPQFTEPKILRHMFATTLQDANVDSLIRNELMGHSPGGKHGQLGMTAVYTHTRPETRRQQLMVALERRPAFQFLQQLLRENGV